MEGLTANITVAAMLGLAAVVTERTLLRLAADATEYAVIYYWLLKQEDVVH